MLPACIDTSVRTRLAAADKDNHLAHRGDLIPESWLIAVVATQSVAVLTALLATHAQQPSRVEMNFLSLIRVDDGVPDRREGYRCVPLCAGL